MLETFTFLDRNALREVALDWKDSLEDLVYLSILNRAQEDLAEAWTFFQRPDLHKLSAVDATSFVIMRRHGIRRAFTFDHHFSMAGCEVVG